MAERANLIAQEQTSFINAVNAYVGVIQAQQLLALNVNNEQVLAKQLQATNDRFRVGEITRTDVAQAEAALGASDIAAADRRGQPADRARRPISRSSATCRPAIWWSRSRCACRRRPSRRPRRWPRTTTRR